MFERYTEQARRVFFFARYEAAQLGSRTIESEHLLLGLMREAKNVFTRFLQGQGEEAIRKDILSRVTVEEKKTTSSDLPLSSESKRILAHAVEESDRLSQRHIGTEHLLLGILSEDTCLAAKVLSEHGIQLQAVRADLAREPMPGDPASVQSRLEMMRAGFGELRSGLFPFLRDNPALPKEGVVRDADTAIRIAEAIWNPIYGEEVVERQKPLQAELKFHVVWIVSGSTRKEGANPLSAFILKADGRILAVGRELTTKPTS